MVVVAPRKPMWTNWTIQPGQSLTSRPEQNFAHMEVTKYVKPKGWRIIGHRDLFLRIVLEVIYTHYIQSLVMDFQSVGEVSPITEFFGRPEGFGQCC